MQLSQALTAVFLAVIALPSYAQYYGGGLDTYGLWEPQTCSIASGSQAEHDACYEEDDTFDFTISQPDLELPDAPVLAPMSALYFTPTKTIREDVYSKYLPKVVRAEIEQTYNGRDLIDIIDEAIQPVGLSTDNLADAMTAWALSANSVIKGQDYEPDTATAQAIQASFAHGLRQAPAIQTQSDAEKQRFAEQLLLFAFSYEQGLMVKSSNPQTYKTAQAAALKHADQMNINFNDLKLVKGEGFVPLKLSASKQGLSGHQANETSQADTSSYTNRKNAALQEYLDNMERMGRQPDPAIVAILEDQSE